MRFSLGSEHSQEVVGVGSEGPFALVLLQNPDCSSADFEQVEGVGLHLLLEALTNPFALALLFARKSTALRPFLGADTTPGRTLGKAGQHNPGLEIERSSCGEVHFDFAVLHEGVAI